MQPHETIELIITNVCAVDGFKWQDVMNAKAYEPEMMIAKHAIAYLLYTHLNIETAIDITGYSKKHLPYCAERYMLHRDKYLEVEKLIYKYTKTAA